MRSALPDEKTSAHAPTRLVQQRTLARTERRFGNPDRCRGGKRLVFERQHPPIQYRELPPANFLLHFLVVTARSRHPGAEPPSRRPPLQPNQPIAVELEIDHFE